MRVAVSKELVAWARYYRYVARQNVKTFTGDAESHLRFREWQAAREAREASFRKAP